MKYISTRGKAEPRFSREVVVEGLAPDGGLYMPQKYPELDLNALRGLSYHDVALAVLAPYMNDIPFATLRSIIEYSYRREVFGPEITPVLMLNKELGLLKLSEGPTFAFKDVPLQFLGNLLDYALGVYNKKSNVVGATSGDTGSAAAYALRGRKNIQLFMLSPKGRMSEVQQLQMYTLQDANIHNIRVNGTFDDCQHVVKQVNADAVFKTQYSIGAVNSINWARIAAQIVYYVYGWLQATKDGQRPVRFAIPSGNFGNALSAYIARKMGLPISILVCTNENDVLHEFFTTGRYRVRKGSEVRVTSSPSMDIAEASNFERFMFDYSGRTATVTRHRWAMLKERGEFRLRSPDSLKRSGITTGKSSDVDASAAIWHIYNQYRVIIDPHTAVAMKVALERPFDGVTLVAETAKPEKFEETIHAALGFEPEMPEALSKLKGLPQRFETIDPDPEAVKRIIMQHA